jgi:hypothetical protein
MARGAPWRSRRSVRHCRQRDRDLTIVQRSGGQHGADDRDIAIGRIETQFVVEGLDVWPLKAAASVAAARLMEFGNVVTVQVLRPPLSQLQRTAKRVFDLAAATAGLVILSPLLIIVAIAIKLDSWGPVLFRQKRHGYNNETIEVFKFRSIVQSRDDGKFVQAVRNDSRVTRVGALLRRTNPTGSPS